MNDKQLKAEKEQAEQNLNGLKNYVLKALVNLHFVMESKIKICKNLR